MSLILPNNQHFWVPRFERAVPKKFVDGQFASGQGIQFGGGDIGPVVSSVPGPFTFSSDDTARTSSIWTTNGIEFTGCALAAADPYRWVLVSGVMEQNQDITGVLINGSLAETVAFYRATGASPDTNAIIARLLVPTGSTCTVKLQTASGTSGAGGINVYTATGGDQAVDFANAGSGTMSDTGPAQPNAIIYTHLRAGNTGSTPLGVAGATETANVVVGGGRMTSGYLASATGGTFSRGTNSSAAPAIATFR